MRVLRRHLAPLSGGEDEAVAELDAAVAGGAEDAAARSRYCREPTE